MSSSQDPRLSAAADFLSRGQPCDAEPLIRALVQERPRETSVLYHAAWLHYQQSRPEKGLEPIRSALDAEPANVDYRRMMAALLREAGHLQEADEADNLAGAIEIWRFVDQFASMDIEDLETVLRNTEEALSEDPGDFTSYLVRNFAQLALASEEREEIADQDPSLNRIGWGYKHRLYRQTLTGMAASPHLAEEPTIALIVTADEATRFPDGVREEISEPLEIILVTEGGNQPSADALQACDVEVRTETGTGEFVKRNLGAMASRAPILLFLDGAETPAPGCVEAHLDAHRQYQPTVVQGACKDTSGDTSPPSSAITTSAQIYRLDRSSNVSLAAKEFFQVGGWPDHYLAGQGATELAERIFQPTMNPAIQLYVPGALTASTDCRVESLAPDPEADRVGYTSRIFHQALRLLKPFSEPFQQRWQHLERLSRCETPILPQEPQSKASAHPATDLGAAPKRLSTALAGRRLVLTRAGDGGNHGIVDNHQVWLAGELQALGLSAETLDLDPDQWYTDFVEFAAKNTDAVFILANRHFDLTLETAGLERHNLLDLLGHPACAIIGDHPYAPFMLHHTERAAKSALYLAAGNSLLEELKILRPDLAHTAKFLIPPPPGLEREYPLPHAERSIDLLIPLGLEKFCREDEERLKETLREVDPRLITLYESMLRNYRPEDQRSLLEAFSQEVWGKLGYTPHFQLPCSHLDNTLLRLLGHMDWFIRMHWRHREIERVLSSLDTTSLSVAVTAVPAVKKRFSALRALPDSAFIGQQPHARLREYYRESRVCLHVGPTYPDQLHERLVEAMGYGCAVLSTETPYLAEHFGADNALVFTNQTKEVQRLVADSAHSDFIGQNAHTAIRNRLSEDIYIQTFINCLASYLEV